MFDDTETADRVLDNGLLCYNTRIPPHHCSRETFTHLLICFKCYKFEDHPTKDCTLDHDVCSECAADDHNHRDCPVKDQKDKLRCLNCEPGRNKHRTLAIKCPYRQDVIREKNKKTETERKETETKRYSDIAKQAILETKTQTETRPNIIQIPTETSKIHLKMTACIIEAHVASMCGNGNFGRLCSENLKANFDIDTIFPDRDSQKIFGLHMSTDVSQLRDNQEIHMETDDADRLIDDDDLRSSAFDLTQETELQSTASALPLVTPVTEAVTAQDIQDFPPPLPPRTPGKQKKSDPKQPQRTTQTKTEPSLTDWTKSRQRQRASSVSSRQSEEPKPDKRKATQELDREFDKYHRQPRPDTKQIQKDPRLETRTKERHTPEEFGLKLYKSELDKVPRPKVATPQYLKTELERQELGLKLKTLHHDIHEILKLLINGYIIINPQKHIHVLPHNIFSKQPRMEVCSSETDYPEPRQAPG